MDPTHWGGGQAAPFAAPQPTMDLLNPTCLGLPTDIKHLLQEAQLAGSRKFIELLPRTVKIYRGLPVNWIVYEHF